MTHPHPIHLLAPALLLLPFLAPGGAAGPPSSSPDATATRPVRFSLKRYESPRALAFSPDGKSLAALTWSRLVLWDLHSAKEISHPLQDCSETPNMLIWSGDSKRLATVHETDWAGPRFIDIWELTNSTKLHKIIRLHSPPLGRRWRVDFSPDGKTLLAATASETIILWDLESGKEKIHYHGGVAAAFSRDGQSIISVSQDGGIHHWKAGTNQLLGTSPHRNRNDFIWAADVVFAPDSDAVVISDDRNIWLKDIATGQTRCRLESPVESVEPSALAVTPEGGLLAVADYRRIAFLDTATGRERASLATEAWIMAFSRDGTTFAWGLNSYPLTDRGDRVVCLADTAALLAAGTKAPRPASDPPGVALKAELIAKRDTYVLDLGGLRAEDFTREWQRQHLDPPEVDLVLKLTNTGNKAIKIDRRWGLGMPTVHLVGPGALNLRWGPRQTGLSTGGNGGTGDEKKPAPLELAAGASHTVAVTRLLRDEGELIWALPGEYWVHPDTCRVDISPAPKGSEADGEGFGTVLLRCAPIKLKVLPANGPSADPLEKSAEPLGALVPPREEAKTRILQTKLNMDVEMKGFRAGTELEAALGYLEDRFELPIRIDEAAFQKAGKEKVGATKVELRALSGVPLRAVLYLILDQLPAGFELRDGTVRVIPVDQPATLGERLPIPYWRGWLKTTATVKKPIKPGTPLAEALRFLEDQLGRCMVIDRQAFVRAKIEGIEKRPVELAAQSNVPKREILDRLLKPAGLTYLLRDGMVLIVPGMNVVSTSR